MNNIASENMFGTIMWFGVGGIFIAVGIALSVKGAKLLYKALFSYITVQAMCVEVQELFDESRGTVYRPIYQYTHEGEYVRASRLEYEEINHTQVGAMETIIVEKKYPDLIVDSKPNAIVGGILLFMGLNFFFTAVAFLIPVVILLFVG